MESKTPENPRSRDPRQHDVGIGAAACAMGVYEPDVHRAIRGRRNKAGKPATLTRMLAILVAALEVIPPRRREEFMRRAVELSHVEESDVSQEEK